jgi:hypothetical protein
MVTAAQFAPKLIRAAHDRDGWYGSCPLTPLPCSNRCSSQHRRTVGLST